MQTFKTAISLVIARSFPFESWKLIFPWESVIPLNNGVNARIIEHDIKLKYVIQLASFEIQALKFQYSHWNFYALKSSRARIFRFERVF